MNKSIEFMPLKYMLGFKLAQNGEPLPTNQRFVYDFNGESYLQLENVAILNTGDTVSLSFFADYNSAKNSHFVGGTTKNFQVSAFIDDNGQWSLDNCTATLDGEAITEGDQFFFDSSIHNLVLTATSDNLTLNKIGADYDGSEPFTSAIWNVDINGEHFYSIGSGKETVSDQVGGNDAVFVGYNSENWIDVFRYRWVYDFNNQSGIQLNSPKNVVKNDLISLSYRAGKNIAAAHTLLKASDSANDDLSVGLSNGLWSIVGCAVTLDGNEILDGDSYIDDGVSHELVVVPDTNQSDIEFIGCLSGGSSPWMDYIYNVTIADSYYEIDGGFDDGGVVEDSNGNLNGSFISEFESNWRWLPVEFYIYNFNLESYVELDQAITVNSGDRVRFRFRAGDYPSYSFKTFFDSESATNRLSVRINGNKQWDIVGGTATYDGAVLTTGTAYNDDGKFHTVEFTSSTDGGNVKYIGCNYNNDALWYDFIRDFQVGESFYRINEGPDFNGQVVDLYQNVGANFINYNSELWNLVEL